MSKENKRLLPLTDLIYGLLGLTFLRLKNEGITRIARDRVYSVLKVLAERYPEYFPNVYFTQRGSLMHSKQVEDTLFHLGGVITVREPRYQYIGFDEEELVRVKSQLQKWFSVDNRKIIKKLVKKFYKEIKTSL